MVVLESLAAIVANLEKELACFRTHVPLFSELLIEISRDMNVDLNVVSEVLLGMLDRMQKHLTCCWKLLQDFYKRVAHSALPCPFFRDSEVGQMPEELVEMLGSMTEHMVRFRRVCESRLKGQHCGGHCNSGYSRSLHLALTCCVTTTEQAKKLVRPVTVRVLRLTAQDLDTKFGLRCRLCSNSVIELREKLKLGEMEGLQRRIRSAALLWNKRRKAQLRSQRKLRLQKFCNKAGSRQKQAIAKVELLTTLLTKQTQQRLPDRITRRSVALAAELEPVNDVTQDKPTRQPAADRSTSKANSKKTPVNARRSSIRRLTEPCSGDSPSFRSYKKTKKRDNSHSGHRKVSATLRSVVSVYDKNSGSGSSSAEVTLRAPESACSARLRRFYSTRSSSERSGRPLLSDNRNGSSSRSSVGKDSGQLMTSSTGSIRNTRRKSDVKLMPLRATVRGQSSDGDNNSSSRRSLRQVSPCHSHTDRKVLTLKGSSPRSQNLSGSTSLSTSLVQSSVTVSKFGPVKNGAVNNVIFNSS